MVTSQPSHGGLRTRTSFASMTARLLVLLLLVPVAALHAQRIAVASRAISLVNTGDSFTAPVDAGLLPTSQPLKVTVHIAPTPDRAAALDQLLVDQTNSSSPNYHKWLTPQQFATNYGATDDQLATLTTWAEAQGLTVAAVSAGKTRLTLSGSTAQVQQAFAVSLHHYLVSGTVHYASTGRPSVPLTVAPMIASVSGLDDLPAAATPMISASTATGKSLTPVGADPLTSASSVVDANTAPVLTLTTDACSTDFAQSDINAYRAVFRQANAQGITVLTTSSCGIRSTGSFPASLPEVTALTIDPTASSFVAIAPRPAWQVAPGLPADGNRYEPDLTTTSVAAFNQTLTKILQQSGGRQGNINATLYNLATTPGLYTQSDNAAAGTWEAGTGLGVVDLAILAKVFPRSTTTTPISTTTTVSSSLATPSYGQSFTLTATVTPSSSATAAPTGTVTFSSPTQGTIGTATLSGTTASLNVSTALNVGIDSLTATYNGDTNYASSSGTTSVTVSLVNATVVASISPATNVPYGSTATVTATVSLPNSTLAAPTGTVSAAIQGITSAVYTATLSPNPGGNSATANIVVAAPPPGQTYTVQVTCAGTANFQCQTPANPTFTTAKGNTLTTVTTFPAAPQAGQPVTLTATITDNGNGPGPYSFTGNVIFYDNGKILATAAVGSNQASTSVTLSGNVSNNIVAAYSGDTNWNTSTSTAQVVNPTLLPSSLTLSSNVTSALAGVNIVFTATVYTTVSNTVGPTGTVSFFDTYNGSIVQLGGTSSAVALTPNGPNQSIARFTTTGLLSGTHSVYAIYNGDANFAPATSSTLPLTITDFNLTMIPQTLTLKAGQTGQVVILVGLVGGFNGTVNFGCTPPANSEATCSFSNASLSGGGSTTMSIFTTAPHATKATQRAGREGPWKLAVGSVLAMLFCFTIPRRRRALPLLFTALLAVTMAVSMGCGLGGTPPSDPSSTPTDPGTPSGTQIFTITAAGSDGVNTVRHIYQYQVTIQ